MYQKSVLPNGLRVLTANIPHARSVSVTIFLGTGARFETKELSGASHFVEHMLFKGTRKRPTAKEISQTIEGIGGVINAETGKEQTLYWAKVAGQHLDVPLDLLADMLLASKFQKSAVEKERAVIIEELGMIYDEPHEWVDILFDETMWGDHPLGWDIAGTRDTVSSLTRGALVDFQKLHYSPDAAVVSIAGNVDHEDVVHRVARFFKRWKAVAGRNGMAPPNGQSEPRLRLQFKETEQAHFVLGVRGLSYFDEDRYALRLLNGVLGEGMSSRLFLEIREKRGLAYDVHSFISNYRDVGAVAVYAGVEPKRLLQAVEAIRDLLVGLKDGIPENEINRSREFWKGRMLLALEDTRAIASWMGSQELSHGRVLSPEEVIAKIDSLTAADLQRVAQRLFVPDGLTLAVLGPHKSEKGLVNLLAF
ncbi:MAG: insulinase family protein [Chloroflexi bacterium]|nr:insulinase family protein [Chloroflexota bacterium]